MYSYQSFIFKIIINLFHHIPFDDIAGMELVKHYGLQTVTLEYYTGAGGLALVARNISQSDKQTSHFLPREIAGQC